MTTTDFSEANVHPDELNYFRSIMEQHGLRPIAAPRGFLAFEKSSVRVTAEDSGEAFEVQHGGTRHVSPSLEELSAYLKSRKI